MSKCVCRGMGEFDTVLAVWLCNFIILKQSALKQWRSKLLDSKSLLHQLHTESLPSLLISRINSVKTILCYSKRNNALKASISHGITKIVWNSCTVTYLIFHQLALCLPLHDTRETLKQSVEYGWECRRHLIIWLNFDSATLKSFKEFKRTVAKFYGKIL